MMITVELNEVEVPRLDQSDALYVTVKARIEVDGGRAVAGSEDAVIACVNCGHQPTLTNDEYERVMEAVRQEAEEMATDAADAAREP
jgi:hypothetical protein